MSTYVDWYGDGFAGKIRQQIIHLKVFNLLSKYGSPRSDAIVYEWITDVLGREKASVWYDDLCRFASLARAIPNASFQYKTSFAYEDGVVDEMYHTIEYANGKLNIRTLQRFTAFDEDDEDNEDNAAEEADDWDEDYQCHVEEDLRELSCTIDKSGHIVGDDELSEACLRSEKEQLSELLELIEKGTDDPDDLVNLGILYETGLAGIDRDLSRAWSFYLKAAETGDEYAVEFLREIFADEYREELHELLANRYIRKEVFDLFFDFAIQENNAEVIAELSEYKASME